MISKMNKLSFLIYHKEYEMFLEKLRELGVVHIEKRQGAEMDAVSLPADSYCLREQQRKDRGEEVAGGT